uniref:Histone-lysine N-methyltransferase ATXR2 n=1 Tax=Anthurium amnicola TaxID=1678845 RepID=A0A1D1YJJ1_9ARAE
MDVSPCPLDTEFADQIALLLAPPSPESAQEYYDDIIRIRQCYGINIKQGKFGKGVYANADFKAGELVLKDQMLVASQHSSNKIDCLVCSYCFCYIGSVELQIGRKLYLQGLRLSAKKDCDIETMCDGSEEECPTERMGRGTSNNHDYVEPCASTSMKDKAVSEEILASLMNGSLVLPYSENFSLPPVVSCPGGCEEEHYCSILCAEADWEAFHSLLCTGGKSDSSRREALVKFIEHANRTNDIFILAAKVISSTILRYKKLKMAHFGKEVQSSVLNWTDVFFSLLLEAWKPISMGFKKRWWDCVALPNDVDCSNEVSFRMQIRDLAYTSLQLLKDAIFDKECATLFSLDIYGHIIGMFELNNLDLVVASPVEDYFIYIDDLPSPLKIEAEKLTRPFLVALGDDYSVYCQGTAFFPLQSCINHSCHPNAKAFKRDEDKDGHATIIALRSIMEGEEITISYIDEDLPYEERQSLLADYGFKCECPRCLEENS